MCPGQQDEKDIFMNDQTTTSQAYKEFVQGMAATVCIFFLLPNLVKMDMRLHQGYGGGLKEHKVDDVGKE